MWSCAAVESGGAVRLRHVSLSGVVSLATPVASERMRDLLLIIPTFAGRSVRSERLQVAACSQRDRSLSGV